MRGQLLHLSSHGVDTRRINFRSYAMGIRHARHTRHIKPTIYVSIYCCTTCGYVRMDRRARSARCVRCANSANLLVLAYSHLQKNNLVRYVGRLPLHMSTQAHRLTHIGTKAHRLTDTWYRHHPSTVRARFRFAFDEMVFVRSHFGSSSQLLGFHTRFHSCTGFTHGFIVTCGPKANLTPSRTGAQFAIIKVCGRYQCTPTLTETSDS